MPRGADGRRPGREALVRPRSRRHARASPPTGRKIVRAVQAGSGYLSTSDPRVLFGLGQETAVKKLTIVWPSGTVQVLEDMPVGTYVRVVEK